MMAVIFEVLPRERQGGKYLETAAALRPLLDQVDGFVSIERFESLAHPGKLLSLSFWRDEAALRQWRNIEAHRIAQERGRAEVFADYRLSVVQVVRQYGRDDREQAPADSRQRHDDRDPRG
jgi:heme-degrading monooxygenase HmoA